MDVARIRWDILLPGQSFSKYDKNGYLKIFWPESNEFSEC
jgi:hypothetical protein